MALTLHTLGFAVVPIVAGTKRPAIKWRSEEGQRFTSQRAVAEYWRHHPDHDIALVVGARVIMLDADTPQAEARLHEIEAAHDVTPNVAVRTKKGLHHYFLLGEGVTAQMDGLDSERNPTGIDIRTGESLAIVPPSTDKSFELCEANCIQDLPVVGQAFVDAITRNNGGTVNGSVASSVAHSTGVADPETFLANQNKLSSWLAVIDPDLGYQDWFRIGAAIYAASGGSDAGLTIFDEWSAKGGKYPGKVEIQKKWASYCSYSGERVTLGTIAHIARTQSTAAPQANSLPTDITATPPEQILDNIETAQPLLVSGFPNQIQTSSGIKLPATVANVRHLLKGYGITARYNIINKRMEILVPGLQGSPENADNTSLTHVMSLATLNGISNGQVPGYVDTIADSSQYNPVFTYLSKKPWDGCDRIEALLSTLKLREGYSQKLARTLLQRWLISAVSAACKADGFRSRGVLVLQGPQSIGKTAWILALVDDPALRANLVKIDHHMDAGDKDSRITAVSHWIVEIGELESSFRKDVARLKGFLTNTVDKVRRPYDRRDSEYPRRTVFCASVNSENFLVDDTGNTRWWTVPVTAVDYEHDIDMQQLWAQVYTLFARGETWWLTPEEEKQLEEENLRHRSVNAIRDLVESTLDTSATDGRWRLATASDVLLYLGVKTPSNNQARECGAVLRELFGEPTRSKGRTRWNVPLPDVDATNG